MNLTVKKENPVIKVGRSIKSAGCRLWDGFKRLPRKRKIIAIVIIVLVMALIGGAVWVFAGKEVNVQVTQTAKVSKGSISNTVVGTGNLELGSSEDIDIPSGITVEEVTVESGDKVSKGDTLAKVNSTSVLKVLSETQDLISSVDSEINDTKGDTESSTIKAGVSGRVKRIYATTGDSVLETMTDHSALMLLSIDGKMAVSLSNADGLSTGDTVKVILSDGITIKKGTVESVTNSNAIITLTDNGPALGEKVTVLKNGTSIGTGKLYIHSKLAVVGTGGTVKSVKVSKNQYVSASTALYTLKDMPASVEYQELLAERQELTKVLSSLVVMAQTNTITASKSGTIENVNVSSGSSSDSSDSSGSSSGTDSSESSSTAGAAQTSASVGSTATVKIMNTTKKAGSSSAGVILTENETDLGTETGSGTGSSNVWDDSQKSAASTQSSDSEESTVTAISSLNVPITAPVKGGTPQQSIGSTTQYTGGISWNLKSGKFQAASTYTARVTLTARSGYQFTQASQVSIGVSGAVVSGISIDGTGEGNTMTFTVTFAKTAADSAASGGSSSDKNVADSSTASRNSGSTSSGKSGTVGASQDSTGTSGASGSSGSSASGSNSTDSSSSSNEIETVAAFSFCSDEEMVLPISVDELDILSIEKGQEASVTFDAIEEKTFTGKITSVSNAATVNGGVAKYSVNITVPADESMLVGMNGSATVTISSKDNIILIPMNALQESGDKTYVYTEKDSDGNLSGEKTVKIGISDGKNVEITSGLDEGDTVYYNKTGAIAQSGSSDSMGKGGFGGQTQDPPSGSGGSSGGGMPSGGAPSGQ